MVMNILITSPPDRASVVAEVYVGNSQLAELSAQGGRVKCELYPRADGHPWRVDVDELIQSLKEAKRRLTSD